MNVNLVKKCFLALLLFSPLSFAAKNDDCLSKMPVGKKSLSSADLAPMMQCLKEENISLKRELKAVNAGRVGLINTTWTNAETASGCTLDGVHSLSGTGCYLGNNNIKAGAQNDCNLYSGGACDLILRTTDVMTMFNIDTGATPTTNGSGVVTDVTGGNQTSSIYIKRFVGPGISLVNATVHIPSIVGTNTGANCVLVSETGWNHQILTPGSVVSPQTKSQVQGGVGYSNAPGVTYELPAILSGLSAIVNPLKQNVYVVCVGVTSTAFQRTQSVLPNFTNIQAGSSFCCNNGCADPCLHG